MSNIDQDIIDEFNDLPFVKSWQNTYVSKKQLILNTDSGELVEKELEDFLYIPGPSLVRHLASVNKFLAFRGENKYGDDWDFKLVDDKFENQNRRMAIFYTSKILDELDIPFMVDEGYGLFVLIKDLAEKAKNSDEAYKEIYLNFAIPKSITTRHGVVESWGA